MSLQVMSKMKWVLALGAGFVGGWAIRSLSDSSEGAGVKLLEIGIETKNRVGRWAAVEGERLEDMLAEARSRVEPEFGGTKGTAKEEKHREKEAAKESKHREKETAKEEKEEKHRAKRAAKESKHRAKGKDA